MFTTNPGPERWRLQFPQAVKSHFHFLEQFGFRIAHEDATLVRFCSDAVVVTVYHGRASYEIGIEFARINTPGEKYGLYEGLLLAQRAGKIKEVPKIDFQTSTQDGIEMAVKKIASLVEAYAVSLLEGDPLTYSQLQVQRTREAAAYTKDVLDQAVRRRVDDAWEDKDYETVVRLYEQIQGRLSPSEFMKFEFAKKLLAVIHGQN